MELDIRKPLKTPSSHHFIICLWGVEYINFFLDFVYPSYFKEGSLVDFKNDLVVVHIISDKQGIEKIKSSTQLQLFRVYPNIELKLSAFEDYTNQSSYAKITNKYGLASVCQEVGIKHALESNAVMYFLPPDAIFSFNTFSSIRELLCSGKRVIFIAGIRAVKEVFVNKYQKVSISDRSFEFPELVNFALEYPHLITSNATIGSSTFTHWPSHLYLKLKGLGYLARCLHLHPLVIFPENFAFSELMGSLDGDVNFITTFCPNQDSYHVITDSSEAMVLELSSSASAVNEVVSSFGVRRTMHSFYFNDQVQSHLHRKFFNEKIKIHNGIESDFWVHENKDFDKFIKGIFSENLTLKSNTPVNEGGIIENFPVIQNEGYFFTVVVFGETELNFYLDITIASHFYLLRELSKNNKDRKTYFVFTKKEFIAEICNSRFYYEISKLSCVMFFSLDKAIEKSNGKSSIQLVEKSYKTVIHSNKNCLHFFLPYNIILSADTLVKISAMIGMDISLVLLPTVQVASESIYHEFSDQLLKNSAILECRNLVKHALTSLHLLENKSFTDSKSSFLDQDTIIQDVDDSGIIINTFRYIPLFLKISHDIELYKSFSYDISRCYSNHGTYMPSDSDAFVALEAVSSLYTENYLTQTAPTLESIEYIKQVLISDKMYGTMFSNSFSFHTSILNDKWQSKIQEIKCKMEGLHAAPVSNKIPLFDSKLFYLSLEKHYKDTELDFFNNCFDMEPINSKLILGSAQIKVVTLARYVMYMIHQNNFVNCGHVLDQFRYHYPEHPLLHYLFSLLFYANQQFKNALSAASTSISLDPHFPYPYLIQAEIYKSQENYPLSVDCLKQFLELIKRYKG